MKTVAVARIFALFFMLFIASCQKKDVIDRPGTPNASGSLNESLLLQLVNERRQAGCNCGPAYYPPAIPLTWNEQLEIAALSHANDMNTNNYFEHTGLDGSSPGERISRTGYNWRAYGENIAKGHSTELAVINAWIASVGHCQNIMNASFREMGAAKAGSYWVQEFGLR